MKLDEIKPGKTYTNGKENAIHRLVDSVAGDIVKFEVIKSPYNSGWNRVGKCDWIEIRNFAKWAKGEVT